jgi:hypothetical protein
MGISSQKRNAERKPSHFYDKLISNEKRRKKPGHNPERERESFLFSAYEIFQLDVADSPELFITVAE